MHASIKFLSVCATISFTPHCRGFVCKLAPTLLSPLRNHVSSFFSTNVATRINMENFVPSLPSPCLNDIGRALQEKMKTDLTAMEQDIQSEEGQRDAFFKLARKTTIASLEMLQCVRNGEILNIDSQFQETVSNIADLMQKVNNDPCQRESRVSFIIEKLLIPRLLHQFFLTGKLAKQSEFTFCNDDEYVGAVIGFCQELCRYAVNRACEGDCRSIELCRSMVVKINQVLIAFDFRNGPLRRKFDGLKYSLKSIEDIAFELSLQGSDGGVLFSMNSNDELSEQDSKRAKSEAPTAEQSTSTSSGSSFNVLDESEFTAICQRMTEYDQHRELVIKESRDVQKLAKQGVFAVVRGQTKDAQQKLTQARVIAEKIFNIVNKFPTLRPGSFGNSLEEWAEGMMLLHWVQHHTIPSKSELGLVNDAEYIGGLSDFTGEIGRIAVMQAAKRDLDSVREIQQADIVVADFISQLNIGNRFGKKLDAVNTNLRKVEDIVYELSMLQRSGRSKRMKVGADLSGNAGETGHEVENTD